MTLPLIKYNKETDDLIERYFSKKVVKTKKIYTNKRMAERSGNLEFHTLRNGNGCD